MEASEKKSVGTILFVFTTPSSIPRPLVKSDFQKAVFSDFQNHPNSVDF